MTTTPQARAEQIIALEAELESAGEMTLAEAELARARAVLHGFVDTVVAVVASPGVGRVALIHADGSQTSIASPTLPYLLSRPVTFAKDSQ